MTQNRRRSWDRKRQKGQLGNGQEPVRHRGQGDGNQSRILEAEVSQSEPFSHSFLFLFFAALGGPVPRWARPPG